MYLNGGVLIYMYKQSNTVYYLSHLHFYPVFTACDWVQCKKNLMNRFKEKITITDFWFIKYLFYHIVGIIQIFLTTHSLMPAIMGIFGKV